MQLHIIPILQDNYVWLLQTSQQNAIIIDPGEAQPVIDYIENHQIRPIGILLTHHHADHIGGVTKLKLNYPEIPIFGPQEVQLPIINISNQNELIIDNTTFKIISIPGHTLGHVAYYAAPYLFCGDTLFSAGCGRIFEGTYQQMFDSLNKLKNFPDDTITCPAHEYTLNNLKFAHHLVPDDDNINRYYQQIQKQKVTLPTTIGKEKQINLFLRCNEKFLKNKFNIINDLELFIFLRTQKDVF